MSEYIVETQSLSKNYGGVQALKNVDLKFEPGKIHALVGENGAGKVYFDPDPVRDRTAELRQSTV